jgi:hypothetical protein
MAELDDTVREIQKRCFPTSRSGKTEVSLLGKYNCIDEEFEAELDELIAYHTAPVEEPTLSKSLKAPPVSHGLSPSSSPPFPGTGATKVTSKASKNSVRDSSPSDPAQIYPIDKDSENLPALLKPSTIVSASSMGRNFKKKIPLSVEMAPPNQLPSPPWNAQTSSKLGRPAMKQIMAEASSAGSGKSTSTPQHSRSSSIAIHSCNTSHISTTAQRSAPSGTAISHVLIP